MGVAVKHAILVHVMASPDEGAIGADEALCDGLARLWESNDAIAVVFHPASIRVGPHWTCFACGESSAHEGEAIG